MVHLTINGKQVTAPQGATILEAARQNGIDIPTLCYDEAVEVYGACGLCVVEAEGIPKLLRSCSAKVSEGMVIHTESERVVQSRKIAMELLMSAHDGDCVAPCQLNCPAHTDCQGYVGLIANGVCGSDRQRRIRRGGQADQKQDTAACFYRQSVSASL